MIVYIYLNEYFTKVMLPIKISGVYPIYDENDKFLANIEEKNGVWQITNNPNINLFELDAKYNEVKIQPHSLYKIENINNNSVYNIYIAPLYDETNKCYKINKPLISVGTKQEFNIYLNNVQNTDIYYQLEYKDGFWYFKNETGNVYVNGIVEKEKKLLHGDYIFSCGTKVIPFSSMLIINNPNNKLVFDSQIFMEYNKDLQIKENSDNISDDIPLYTKGDYFLKAPRFMSIIEEARVVIDEPPAAMKESENSLLLQIGPQITMMLISLITLSNYIISYLDGNTKLSRLLISLATTSIMLIGAFTWPALTRHFAKKRRNKHEEKRQEKYKAYLLKKEEQINLLKIKQKQILTENNITLENCANAIRSKNRNLWERYSDHEDFLSLRIGIGSVPTKLQIDIPEDKFSIEDKDNLFGFLQEIVNRSLFIEEVPYCVSLVDNFITAVVGKEEDTKYFLDGLFLRMLTFHPYTELKIVVLTNKSTEKKWDYLKTSPHIWNNSRSIRYFADNPEDISAISNVLEKEYNNRLLQQMSSTPGAENTIHKPYYMIFTDDINAVRNTSIVKKITENSINCGFSLLILNDRLATLPSETTAFISVDRSSSGIISKEIVTGAQREFKADFNYNIDMYEMAALLANIPVEVEKEKLHMPLSLSFLEMYNVGKIEQLNSLERWSSNNPYNSLSVPMGINEHGELLKMDIHEKAYGPHGLIAGTTGSGKSEWIITYILSLAVNFSPDEIQFVLIDYKGGGLAMSFENSELGVKLPHLAGTVTNLDKSSVVRVIESIESELKRRQRIFNETREKLKEGSMNIYKYQDLYRKKLVDEPMSHLLIISDEFAELKQQQPEFMDQLISTSRIGRSLGVHLILATQKPSGVVNDQIWSNSRFKVCLKVQNKSDSMEILKKADAAYLKQIGSFYLQVGNDEVYSLAQSAWAGAKYFPSEIIKKTIDQSIEYIDSTGKTLYTLDSEEKEIVDSQGEELLNVVAYLSELSAKENYSKKQLWLPNIKPISYLNDLIKKYNHKFENYNYNIVVGEYDYPRAQVQNLLKIDVSTGNIGIIGQTNSGKEMLVSTLIWSSIIEHAPQEINYYIIDFGAETLKKFANFPHVGEVLYQEDSDKVIDLFEIISKELEKRKELFAEYNGSFVQYNKYNKEKVALFEIVIVSFDVFLETFPRYDDFMTTMFRDCSKYGINFIITGTSTTAIRSRQRQYIKHNIMLKMQDDTIYRAHLNIRKNIIPGNYIGRGICRINESNESYCEFQTAFIAPPEQEYQYIKTMAEKFNKHYNYKAKEFDKIPEKVDSDYLSKYITDLKSLPIGYDLHGKDIAKMDLITNKVSIIMATDIKNHMGFIYSFISLVSKVPGVKVRVVDFLGLISESLLDFKLFNDNFDVVMAALEKDVLTRTEVQDNAINIFIGLSNMKSKLSDGGLEIMNNMFNSMSNSKNINNVFIDNYNNIRELKLNKWYINIVNENNGLWLGNNFSTQSLFISNEVLQTDKAKKFDGIAYLVENSKYSLIKAALEGDENV